MWNKLYENIVLQKGDCSCAPLPVSTKKLTGMVGVPIGAWIFLMVFCCADLLRKQFNWFPLIWLLIGKGKTMQNEA